MGCCLRPVLSGELPACQFPPTVYLGDFRFHRIPAGAFGDGVRQRTGTTVTPPVLLTGNTGLAVFGVKRMTYGTISAIITQEIKFPSAEDQYRPEGRRG